jgi:hypothetical protein
MGAGTGQLSSTGGGGGHGLAATKQRMRTQLVWNNSCNQQYLNQLHSTTNGSHYHALAF